MRALPIPAAGVRLAGTRHVAAARPAFAIILTFVALSAACRSGERAGSPAGPSRANASESTAAEAPGEAGTDPPAAAGSADASADFTRDAEIGCSLCIYHMPDAADCVLAVKLDGRAYLVEGSGIDDHGDAHAPDGLCNMARPARVSGHIAAGRFVARSVAAR